MKEPKFKIGQKVMIVKLLDNITSKDLIGTAGTISEIDPLPNGDFNYDMKYTFNIINVAYVHEEELEAIE